MGYDETRKLSDKYEVSNILGRGGFSVVQRGTRKKPTTTAGARDKTQTHVAIKTLRRLNPSSVNAGSQKSSMISVAMGLGYLMWKQVSVSNALPTNKIVVMRKIVEDVLPHKNVIHPYDVETNLCLRYIESFFVICEKLQPGQSSSCGCQCCVIRIHILVHELQRVI